jgi:alkanesulfonate monooxygenase SsuD/methylene tetrahydromethanopterin reductase-like flavin-dependent oxidoreductase (luciferase family)
VKRGARPLRIGLALGGPLDPEQWRATLALAEWADAAGVDSIWLPEGHFRPGATAAPLLALAALAARTRRIRLGTTSLLISVHDPRRVAAEVAALDQLSGGRVILGVGRGFDPLLFDAFGLNPRQKRDRFDAALDAILAAWSGGAVTSRPLQRPHPPLVVAAFGSKGLAQAARRGLPYLASPIESLDALAANHALHRAQLPPGVDPGAVGVPVMRTVHVTDDPDEARRTARALEEEFGRIAARAGAVARRAAGPSAAIIGDPAAVARSIAAYRDRIGMDLLVVRPPPGLDGEGRRASLERLLALAARVG